MRNFVVKLPLKHLDSYHLANIDFYTCDCGHSEKAEILGIYNEWALLLSCRRNECPKKWYAFCKCEKTRTKMTLNIHLQRHEKNKCHLTDGSDLKVKDPMSSKWVKNAEVVTLPLEVRTTYAAPTTNLWHCDCGHGEVAHISGIYNDWALLLHCSDINCSLKWYACSSCPTAHSKLRTVSQINSHETRKHQNK